MEYRYQKILIVILILIIKITKMGDDGSKDSKMSNLNAKALEKLLKQFNSMAVAPKVQKQMADYKFWKTQPVSAFGRSHSLLGLTIAGEEAGEEEGPIEPSLPKDQVPSEQTPMAKDFEWSTMDLTDPGQVGVHRTFLSV
jgi:glycylpeptide N-tetradecanoyltransferase